MLLALATLTHTDAGGRTVLHAMPVMIAVLVIFAIAYRFYSKFLATKVLALNDARPTPAVRLNDHQNYHPTNKWVAFGHHFAAISGAGPLIGPVLAIQYGYLPGLLWLVIGVCAAGAVQDMLILAVSVRRDGKSLGEIARAELGVPASIVASVAVLVIVVIALAGLGFVVVKALGGEEVKLPAGMVIETPTPMIYRDGVVQLPPHCTVRYSIDGPKTPRSEAFNIQCPTAPLVVNDSALPEMMILPKGSVQLVPGSSWGTFTIAMTIPIAILVGLMMKRWKNLGVLAGSLVGGALTLFAVVAGGWIPGSSLEGLFSLSKDQTILALVAYGFVAAVLPVWLLLGPRDYLSSFLKIGTVALLIGSVIVANPPLHAPPVNEVFINGGPTFEGDIFPFVFICVMCGSISGFHALVASGTTPKMIEKESHIRPIGYGAMLMESIVAVTALIAAASLPNDLYYDINIAIDDVPKWQRSMDDINMRYGSDRLHAVGVDSVTHLDLGQVETQVGGESLRGRTGGAVTLAVGMSVVFRDAFQWLGVTGDWLLKYWYHFAIMFEALFILTTIDAGTRIGRFLLQETLGRLYAPFARPDWLPGAILASAVITGTWGWLIYAGSIRTIWPMFGVANQLLAVLALTLATTWLVNTGRAKYMGVTLIPLMWVATTALSAGTILVTKRFPHQTNGAINAVLTLFVMCTIGGLVMTAMARWVAVLSGRITPPKV